MSLGDIHYKYQVKIDNLNNRITRYNEIINDYENKINKAEKKENPNISSVINSKLDYEHKIQNMECVKEYYQEFVDTSEYLMQFLNENETHLLIRKNEDLIKQLDKLQQDYDYLVNSIGENSNQVNSLTGKINRLSNENTRLKADLKYYKPYYRNSVQFEDYIEELQTKIRDLEQCNDDVVKKNAKLVAMVEDLNEKLKSHKKTSLNNSDELKKQNKELDELKRQNKVLEDYCNHLLSRTGVVMDV